MEIVKYKCKDLIGAEYNPRELTDKQYKDLRDSLTRFGIVDPVIVNINSERKNIIIGGHQRVRVWEGMGNTEIPCVELNLTIEQEKELNIRLNKNTGQFDFDMLSNYFDQDSLVEWGFESHQIDFEPDVDYSVLEDNELDNELDEMTAGVKKAIQIEFDLEHYEEAKELVKFWRDQDAYVGAMIIEKLKDEKEKL